MDDVEPMAVHEGVTYVMPEEPYEADLAREAFFETGGQYVLLLANVARLPEAERVRRMAALALGMDRLARYAHLRRAMSNLPLAGLVLIFLA